MGTWLFQQFLCFLARGEHKEISLRALIILHGGADACDVVEFTADAWPKGYFVRFNVSTCGGIGWCWNRPQTMFRDKTFALRESMRMRGGYGGIFRIGSRTHVRVKSNVDAHACELTSHVMDRTRRRHARWRA